MTMHRLGASVVVMETFDPAECLAAIERYHVTHAQFVPTMFTRMLRLPEEERNALRPRPACVGWSTQRPPARSL